MPGLLPNLPESLHMDILTEAVRNIRFPERLPSESFSWLAPEKRINGDTFVWETIVEDRRPLEYVGNQSAATTQNWAQVQENAGKIPLIKDKFGLLLDNLNQLRKPGTTDEELGLDWLTSELKRRMFKIKLSREIQIFKALSDSYQIQLDGNTKSFTDYKTANFKPDAAATWATATNDILADIDDWKVTMVQGPGYVGDHAFINSNVVKYLRKNDDVSTYLGGTNRGVQYVESAFETFNVNGVNHTVMDLQYADPTNSYTLTNFVVGDKYMLMSSDPGWNEMVVGNVPVLDNNENPRHVFGPASYSIVSKDPVGREILLLDRHLFTVKIADATIYAETTP